MCSLCSHWINLLERNIDIWITFAWNKHPHISDTARMSLSKTFRLADEILWISRWINELGPVLDAFDCIFRWTLAHIHHRWITGPICSTAGDGRHSSPDLCQNEQLNPIRYLHSLCLTVCVLFAAQALTRSTSC